MEEPVGAQYAVQIAVHTLKDRCRNFQQRIADLEEENVKLRLQATSRHDNNDAASLPEIDNLKEQIIELSEQKQQLLNKVKMVTGENQELWRKLSRLTQINQSLGAQLSKIDESLTQHTTKNKEPLIRSKTFTQNEPHTKVLQRNLEENGKISLELEDISLKMINSIARDKSELESLYSAMAEIQCSENIITDSIGFCFDEELDGDVVEDFKAILDELKATKTEVEMQKQALRRAVLSISRLKESKSLHSCNVSKLDMSDKSTETVPSKELIPTPSLPEIEIKLNSQSADSLETDPQPPDLTSSEMICPMCSQNFHIQITPFKEFQLHVERHFTLADEDQYEIL